MNEEGASFYSLRRLVWWGILGSHPCNRPPRALIALPEEGGARRSWGRCGRTLAYMPSHRLWRVGSWLGLGHSYASAFWYVFMCCPTKYLNTKTCGECELKTLFLSFGILYSFILFKMLAVKIWVKHRHQAPPHLILCSSSSKVQWTKRVHLLDLKICIQVILSFTWTCELPSVYQNILGNWKIEQLGFKSSHSILAQKLGFLYGFENIKIAFVPWMILSSHSNL